MCVHIHSPHGGPPRHSLVPHLTPARTTSSNSHVIRYPVPACKDTGGATELIIGRWLALRQCRDKVWGRGVGLSVVGSGAVPGQGVGGRVWFRSSQFSLKSTMPSCGHLWRFDHHHCHRPLHWTAGHPSWQGPCMAACSPGVSFPSPASSGLQIILAGKVHGGMFSADLDRSYIVANRWVGHHTSPPRKASSQFERLVAVAFHAHTKRDNVMFLLRSGRTHH